MSYALQLGKAACDKVQRLALRANEEAEKLGFCIAANPMQLYDMQRYALEICWGVAGKSPIKLSLCHDSS